MDSENRPHLRPVGDGPPPSEGALARQPAQTEKPTGITSPTRRGGSGRFLTEVLVEMGLVERGPVDAAIEAARSAGRTPEQILLEEGALTSDQLARAVAERYGLDHLDLNVLPVDMGAANLINAAAAKRYEAVPISFVNDRMVLVAMVDPSNVLAVDDIAIMTGLEVRPAVASREDVAALIARLNRLDDVVHDVVEEAEAEGPAEVVDLRESADDAPVIKLVHSIVAQAVEQGASDIHFEPAGDEMRVRFRVDGVLASSATVPRRMVRGVVSRIKIMADLDISERRLPQDGRVGLSIENRHIDVRVVTLPSVHGESVVMRILDKESAVVDLDKLGMGDEERAGYESSFHQAHGAVLATGPTGSGKSTTLYAALQAINTPEKNIITIEDPVEYQVEGITQVQVNPKAGLTFATGLRSMMRADPDVIMVGEIRDSETAKIAVESALTGHLVLSTLHTNDAPTAVTRLLEMGIEPFLVASAIDCVVAQRLARTLCPTCKKRTLIPAQVLRENGFTANFDLEAYDPAGCGRCGHSGYKGRTGLYEVMKISTEIRELIIERASADRIAAVAVEQGMRRLRDDGLEKVRLGRTSIAEVARVSDSG
ncbi:MAG: type pilus assembly protein PilB [Solirubrobacteraceae bacterium]|jgi:type IV pilus assembly protein PilB|nr:type pilus assembly protein PilB [Solirubrobacteraceae bacterium]